MHGLHKKDSERWTPNPFKVNIVGISKNAFKERLLLDPDGIKDFRTKSKPILLSQKEHANIITLLQTESIDDAKLAIMILNTKKGKTCT